MKGLDRPPIVAARAAGGREEFLRGSGARAPAMPLVPPAAPAGGEGGGAVRPLRGRGVPVRRRRRWPVVLQAFAAAALLVGVPAAAGAWLLASPRFDLAAIEVASSERVEAEWVHQRLEPFLGRNLVVLPLETIGGRLAGHPWVAGAAMTKELPDRLRVTVVEARPAALLADPDGRVAYVGEDGRRIAPVPADAVPAAELPRLVLAPGAEPDPEAVRGALATARAVAGAEPGWTGGRPPTVEILGPEDHRLHLAALPYPLLVRRGGLRSALAWWRAVGPEVAERHPRLEAVDLRFAGRIVVRPAPGVVDPAAPDAADLSGATDALAPGAAPAAASPGPLASDADAFRLEERLTHAEA